MHTNLLKLNDAKTEFIALGTPQQMSLAQDLSIKIGKHLIHTAGKVRNLGFMMDKFMKNSVHSKPSVKLPVCYDKKHC